MECSICHDEMNANQDLITHDNQAVTTTHVFHKDCIQKWYQGGENQHTCPICRQKIVKLDSWVTVQL
jgi:hypothetical protein